jgi:hypothetical protein
VRIRVQMGTNKQAHRNEGVFWGHAPRAVRAAAPPPSPPGAPATRPGAPPPRRASAAAWPACSSPRAPCAPPAPAPPALPPTKHTPNTQQNKHNTHTYTCTQRSREGRTRNGVRASVIVHQGWREWCAAVAIHQQRAGARAVQRDGLCCGAHLCGQSLEERPQRGGPGGRPVGRRVSGPCALRVHQHDAVAANGRHAHAGRAEVKADGDGRNEGRHRGGGGAGGCRGGAQRTTRWRG